jgi:pyridoxal phosphate enzyme (YggS family)
MDIEKNIEKVLERISNSAVKAGRNPNEIKLVAVSKTVTLQRILEAVKAGVTILGENRVQEAREKISNFKFQIAPPAPPLTNGGMKGGVEWHLIGNLQKNKAGTAVQLFNLIHSVDSTVLVEELDKHAKRTGKKQRVLMQVKLSDESTKHGVLEGDLIKLLEKVFVADSLLLEGFMTMPPYFEDPEKTRPYFRRLYEIAKDVSGKGFAIKELSMGMSNDYEVAIEEGATMVRVGTAIFGERHDK